MDLTEKITGALLGTAVGDALGLPREGLSRRRALKLCGDRPLRHRFIFGRGMLSDDTEHACMAAQALLASRGEPGKFARSLAWRLRGWILALPAGVGFGTLRAIIKLWLGFPPGKSGVYSAGNGPAMRAPLLGVCAGGEPQRTVELVRASTRLTHTDPRAEEGALAVALAASHGARHGAEGLDAAAFLEELRRHLSGEELLESLKVLEEHLGRGAAAQEFADKLGLGKGVGGYINHTVPVCLYCWLRHKDDFRAALEEVILLGGDADTTGAIVGGLAGATLGAQAIPAEWLSGIVEWPRSVGWMRRLAQRLAENFPLEASSGKADKETPTSTGPLPLFWPGILPRNLFFIPLVLLHGLRRLLPPY